MRLEELKKKKVAIWGYGIEGKATADYLLLRCKDLSFTVICPADEVPEQFSNKIKFEHHEVSAQLLDQFGVVIKSPGISPYQEAVTESNCKIISSSALWFSNEESGKVIAITGTKGKSTTAAMLTKVLDDMGFNVILAGNFGIPLITCLDKYDYVILETSSYQAQDGSICADIGVLLNLFSEHLDWHKNELQYHVDKWRLLTNARKMVLNAKDHNTKSLLQKYPCESEPVYFECQQGFYVLDSVLMYKDKALLSQYGWELKGDHNLQNAAAVCAVIALLKLDIKVCMNAIKAFKALPHRLELVTEINGVFYINDSISSTPHATLAAIETINVSRTILLVGGYDRGVDWLWWVEKISSKPPRVIICSGQNGQKIQQLILNHELKTQCIGEPNLQEAVKTAKNLAKPGDTVLLSPGAPSFDAFDNYQHRGERFIQWIK